MGNNAIIIEGNIFEGFTFHGPFSDFETAIEWAEKNVTVEWLIATLEKPTEPKTE